MDEGAAAVTIARVWLKVTTLFARVATKLAPEIVTGVPGVAIAGLNPLIVGAMVELTVKAVALVAEPFGEVTLIGPVVAPPGTIATMDVVVAEVTVAVKPLNRTVFWLGVELNPVP
jgi:hypothetical protein